MAELNGVELIYEGTFRPAHPAGAEVTFSDADIEDIKTATEQYQKDTAEEPYAKLDHTESQPLLDVLKAVSLGNVKKLYTKYTEKMGRRVKTLCADFADMPPQFYNMVTTGLAKKRSVEIETRPNYGKVLKAIAFFGVGSPAVKALAELGNSMIAGENRALPDDKNGTVVLLIEESQNEITELKEEKRMDELKELNEKLSAALARIAELEAEQKTSAQFKETEQKHKAELDTLKAEKAAIELQFAEAKKELDTVLLLRKKERDDRISGFVDSMVKAGKVMPAKREITIAKFMAFGDNEELVTAEMEFISGKAKADLFSEKVPGNGGIGKRDYSDPDAQAGIENDIKTYLKEHSLPDNLENYKLAAREIGFIKEAV